MKLKKNNWWIKFMKFTYGDIPTNLCMLISRSIFVIPLFILSFPFGIVLVFSEKVGEKICANLIMFFLLGGLAFTVDSEMEILFDINLLTQVDTNWFIAILYSVIGVVEIIVLFLIFLLVEHIRKEILRVFNKPRFYTTKAKKPSILKAYLKAKKDKLCPIIEYHD